MKKWIFPIAAFFAAIAVSFWSYPHLPDSVAIHFDTTGQPDDWVSKPFAAFLLPAMILLVPAVIFGTARLQPSENERRRAASGLETVTAVVAAVMLGTHVFTMAYNMGYELSVPMFASVTVGVMFIVVGNILPRMPQGRFRYPRLSDKAYPRFARFAGRVMVGCGVALLLTAMLPGTLAFPVSLGIFCIYIATVIVAAIYFDR